MYLLLLSKVKTHEYLLIISDGSVDFHNIVFGWIMSTPNGEHLAVAYVPSSRRGTSLHSEVEGMLSSPL